ncbi:MAG: hypothetical protein QG623_553 [Patescibacteria group bacterium]|nr:hypothetical protein [Patescibacteria group bacterium]
MPQVPTLCGKDFLRSIEFKAQHRSSTGEAIVHRRKGNIVSASGCEAKAEDHKKSAHEEWEQAKEKAKNATKKNCTECLGKLGVELCPLLSEVEVTIDEVYDAIGGKRDRFKSALRGEIRRSSPSDYEIASSIGTLISDIDEDEYSHLFDPSYEPRVQKCPFTIAPESIKRTAREIERGVDPKESARIGEGGESAASISPRLSDTEPFVLSMDAEAVLRAS